MYLEDFTVGWSMDLEPFTLTEEQIIEFAETYDPRDIHTNREEAEKSQFKGLIASGYQTLAVSWGQFVHTKLDAEGVVAGRRINNVEWLLPTYPNTPYTGHLEVTQVDMVREDRGDVQFYLEVKNPEGEITTKITVTAYMRTRPEQAQ
ncbi:MAG: MaoC/PaaZ C-terminal domain-containing protein [Tissierellia bacterium]|nr:MaoC/PaaZ C-terminal domain-containing protein [Tissierellia bacterium]